MQGKVVRIFSDFYYVKVNNTIFECKLREVLKKSGIQVLVGDDVCIENIQENSSQAAICKLLERRNFLIRPSVANIDLIITVVALKHPKTPFSNIDRYLAQAQYFGIETLLCVNKSDLLNEDIKDEFFNLYNSLGYKVVFTSALYKTGIDELKKHMNGKTSILCGVSGVGKTSLCNAINDKFVLKTGKVSKNTRGAHTTRHCEIFSFAENNETSNIVDTPGFSLLKFDYIEPQTVKMFFPEIAKLSHGCKFSDCLHENEADCNVIKNIDLIAQSRYQSYIDILQEAKEYKNKIKSQGKKTETRIKEVNSKMKPKISAKQRDLSRKKSKQLLQTEY